METMQETVSPGTLELLAWIASRPRTYADAMEAWRSTCPRHPVWEDALIGGLIEVSDGGARLDQTEVKLTLLGKAMLNGNK